MTGGTRRPLPWRPPIQFTPKVTTAETPPNTSAFRVHGLIANT